VSSRPELLERADAALNPAEVDGPVVLAAEQLDQRAAGGQK
jgi:hypothetical protein